MTFSTALAAWTALGHTAASQTADSADAYVQATSADSMAGEWVALAGELFSAADVLASPAAAKINTALLSRVFLVGHTVSPADTAVYAAVHGAIASADVAARMRLVNLVRWFDHVQHLVGASGPLALVAIDRNAVAAVPAGAAAAVDPKIEAARKKKAEKAAKKAAEKAAKKAEKAAAPAKPDQDAVPAIARLDIRVGRIGKAWKHPDADSLYVEEIDVGEDEPRTVVSGLVKFIPLEDMQNRLVTVFCNLKPSTMRGIKSHAMVFCATSPDGATVEFVEPPAGAVPGERIAFAGFDGHTPDAPHLPPKKKVWEQVQPDLATNADKVACFKDIPFMTSAGPCTVQTVVKGSIK